MKEDIISQLRLHLQFYDDNYHEIDAHTLLKAEKNIVDFITFVSKELDIELEVRILAREPGSLWDNFKFIYNNPITGVVISAVLSKFFSPKPKLSTEESTEKTLANYSALKNKVKSKDLTIDEAKIFFENDKALKKHKTEFFKSLESNDTVKSIDTAEDGEIKNSIPRGEFHRRIYADDELIDIGMEVDDKAKIYIVSPVTVKVKEKWTGFYQGKKIQFSIRDEEFLEEVYKAKIDFNAHTFIICKLKIESTTNVRRKTQSFEVINVHEHGEEQERLTTIKYKKKENTPKTKGQMSLFDI